MRFDDWNNDELYHHGIKGQKWGFRRYQNPDGSLTPAGRLRYLKEEARLERRRIKETIKTQRAQLKANRKINTAESKVKLKNLSDDELKARISRLNLEKEYKELKNDVRGISYGKKMVESLLTHVENAAVRDLKKEEFKTRIVEAREKTKQAKQNAKQAEQNAAQAARNRDRDEINKKANIIKAKNEKEKLKIARKMIGTKSSKYKDYMNGKITIDELLGLTNKKDDN